MVGGLKMKKTGAARVITSAGPVWCHFSQKDAVTKLRRYSGGSIFELNVDGVEIEEFVPLNVCETLVKAPDGYSYSNSDLWTKILRKLEAKVAPFPKDSAGRAKTTPITVPITFLRQFYETMKLLETATWVNLAKFYSENPKSLERLWSRSREAFLSYKNEDDWGRGETESLPIAPESVGAIKTTDEFTAFITEHDNRIDDDQTGYTFVEREINPRRTRRGVFSDKRPATKSGTGGIDVLLKSHVTGFPAVGEVKVDTDKNAFFALIQAMTYAVELSTPNQLTRLRKHFGDNFRTLVVDEAKVEIVLLMVNHVKDDSREPVLKLVKALNERKECEGLGRVVLVENHGDKWVFHS